MTPLVPLRYRVRMPNVQTGTLYIVTTPIGNLEDLTPRAARVLREVALIAAEDTRQSRKLLTHLGISNRLVSYNEHNTVQRTPSLLQTLETDDIALVSDAGVPAVSDPGADLVRAAAEHGIRVVPIPGPSAVTAALSVAGMFSPNFKFVGFAPRTAGARRKLFGELATERATLVVFEAPHRVRATLEAIAEVLGDRPMAICREITKLHEEIFRGTATESLAHFESPRGEFVFVIEGAVERVDAIADPDGARDALATLKARGESRRDAVVQVTDAFGVSKREAYKLWLAL
jgi:16S rRNA (cytidine1402-2'-O)-methyltransferase